MIIQNKIQLDPFVIRLLQISASIQIKYMKSNRKKDITFEFTVDLNLILFKNERCTFD